MTDDDISTEETGGSRIQAAAELAERLQGEVRKVFFGQDEVVRQSVAALLAGGHVLLEGKPGLGKTHLVLALAQAFGGVFGRVQFTPDLMPTDVTGFTLFDMKTQTFQTRKGPVFANLLLADEINRAPAKTQAALLEVMQERQVTIDGESHVLAPPFLCFATQNPIEQEGTYPLPEAQLDRFLMKVIVDYPEVEDEMAVVAAVTSVAAAKGLDPEEVETVCGPEDVVAAQEAVAEVTVVGEVVNYAVRLVRATREARGISLGAGTRAAIGLVQCGKAYALMDGRDFVIPDDIKAAVYPVFRHRLQVAPEVAISGQGVEELIAEIVAGVEAPRQ